MSKIYKKFLSLSRDLRTRVKLFFRKYQTIIEVLLVIVLLFIVSVRPSVAEFLNRNSGVLEVVSSIVIACAALYFARESVLLEKKKLKPSLTLLRPFLAGSQVIIPIKNIGLGPAYYISIHLYEVNKEVTLLIKYIEYLPPNQCDKISLPAWLLKKTNNNKKEAKISQRFHISYYDFLWNHQFKEEYIGDEWLLDFNQLENYLKNNQMTISDALGIVI